MLAVLTNIQKTLVGESGSTYKYLGLQLFSHPPSSCPCTNSSRLNDDSNFDTNKKETSLLDLGYLKECANTPMTIGKLNQFLIQCTNKILQKQNKQEKKLLSSANYNLTLIYRMEPLPIENDLYETIIFIVWEKQVSVDKRIVDYKTLVILLSITLFKTMIP